MNKKTLICLAILSFFVMSCGSIYMIQNEKPAPSELFDAKTISVSWLDMSPSKWKEMNFENEKDWSDVITELNTKALRQYFNDENKNRKTISYRNQNEAPVKTADLNIELKMVKYELNYNAFTGGTDRMHTEVKFLNKDGKEIYSAYVISTMKGVNGWAAAKFEARIDICVYNLVQYLVKTLYKEQK